MTIEKYLKTALPLTAAGVLFAGYMTGVKWFSGACAFSEPCPTLFGQPACAYGFVIFSTMLIVTLVHVLKQQFLLRAIKFNLVLSGFGILFSGYFAVPEMIHLLQGKTNYLLGLPSCAYGLVFYVAIFVVTLIALLQNRGVTEKSVETEEETAAKPEIEFAD